MTNNIEENDYRGQLRNKEHRFLKRETNNMSIYMIELDYRYQQRGRNNQKQQLTMALGPDNVLGVGEIGATGNA